MDPVAQT